MKVVGIGLVKDEFDVIERTVRHMAGQVDELLVADNASSDGTRVILSDLERELPLTVLDDPDPRHYQSRKLTALAWRAKEMGATWAVPFDADELWSSPEGPIAEVFRQHHRTWIFTAELFDHVPTASDGEGHPFDRMGWRRVGAEPLLKVAARTHRDLLIGEGSHTCDYAGSYPRTSGGLLRVAHFPYRSPEQFVKKALNGSRGRGATDLSPDIGAHLREYGRVFDAEGGAGLRRLFRERFWCEFPEGDESLVYDPVSTGETCPA